MMGPLAPGGPPGRARRRLRLGLGAFFLALSIPSAALVYRAYDQLKWESFRRQQLAAQDLAQRIDRRLGDLARAEDARPPADYGFLGAGVGRSPLGEYPIRAEVPGLVGWFQVAEDGRFTTPLVPDGEQSPAALGLGPGELAARQAQAARIEGVLIGNRLVERVPGQPRYDREPAAAPAPGLGDMAPRASSRRGAPARSAKSATDARPRLSQRAFDDLSAPPQVRDLPETARGEDASRSAGLSPGLSAGSAPRSAPGSDAPRGIAPAVQGLGRVDELSPDSAPIPPIAPEPRERPAAEESLSAPLAEGFAGAPPTAAPPDPAGPANEARSPPSESPAHATRPTGPAPGGAKDAPGRPGSRTAGARVGLFGNAVEPFELGLLGSGHLVLFRAVHRDGERLVQGLLVEQGPFLADLMEAPFRIAPLAADTDLIVAFRDRVLAAFRARAGPGYVASARELTGALLYRTRLQEPFGALELIFGVDRLPVPPGAAAIGWVGGMLALVLTGGTWLMYRLGLRQLDLVRQQQAFVSAVSHELKTPLTSIRMYAEMLRAGFANEDRRQVYYRYIQEESERLSRLIANVLALSRIGRDTLALAPRELDLGELMAQARERLAAPAERAGFQLDIHCTQTATDAATGAESGVPIRVLADPDALLQILINLVDNALKFAAQSEPRRVEVRYAHSRDGWAVLSVRDFGPGVPRELRRRVFELFYRGPEAGERAVPGTGIGLALVERLARAMGGRVELVGREPGLEVRLELPCPSDPRFRRQSGARA